MFAEDPLSRYLTAAILLLALSIFASAQSTPTVSIAPEFVTPPHTFSALPRVGLLHTSMLGSIEFYSEKQFTFWEQYKGRIGVALGVMLLQTILISGLLVERGRTKRAAQKRKESEQRLAELTGRLLRTQDEERRRIARELHDVTAQSIGLLMLNLAQVQQATAAMDEETKDKLSESMTFG